MIKFAFIIHTTDLSLFSKAIGEPGLTKKRKELLEQVFTWFPPFHISDIVGIKSKTGKEIEGFFIYSTLLPQQLLKLDQKFVLKRIVEGGKTAEKLGARILGLGAYAALIGRKGALVAKELSIPVTTGTNYTIAVSIDAVLEACVKVNLDLKCANIAVIGATGSIGSIICNYLADKVKNIILIARNYDRLEALEKELNNKHKCNIKVSTDLSSAIREANVIIISTNYPGSLLLVKDLRPGTIVCDISQPRNVSQEDATSRKDILVIDGGVVEVPGSVNFNFYYGLPSTLAYACIAETMILTLEEIFESYSIGGNVSFEKVKQIRALADKHGFKLAALRSFGADVTEAQVNLVKKYILQKKEC